MLKKFEGRVLCSDSVVSGLGYMTKSTGGAKSVGPSCKTEQDTPLVDRRVHHLCMCQARAFPEKRNDALTAASRLPTSLSEQHHTPGGKQSQVPLFQGKAENKLE